MNSSISVMWLSSMSSLRPYAWVNCLCNWTLKGVHGIEEEIKIRKLKLMKSLPHFKIYNLLSGILIDRYSLKNFPSLSHVMTCFFRTLTVVEVIKYFLVMERYADIRSWRVCVLTSFLLFTSVICQSYPISVFHMYLFCLCLYSFRTKWSHTITSFYSNLSPLC